MLFSVQFVDNLILLETHYSIIEFRVRNTDILIIPVFIPE